MTWTGQPGEPAGKSGSALSQAASMVQSVSAVYTV